MYLTLSYDNILHNRLLFCATMDFSAAHKLNSSAEGKNKILPLEAMIFVDNVAPIVQAFQHKYDFQPSRRNPYLNSSAWMEIADGQSARILLEARGGYDSETDRDPSGIRRSHFRGLARGLKKKWPGHIELDDMLTRHTQDAAHVDIELLKSKNPTHSLPIFGHDSPTAPEQVVRRRTQTLQNT